MQSPFNADQTPSTLPAPIIFTKSAARKVWELIQEEGNPALKLRVFITGGGCSGFQYGFSFDEEINEDDVVIYGEIGSTDEEEGSAGATEAGDEEGDAGNTGAGSPNSTGLRAKAKKQKHNADNKVMLLVDSMSLQYLIGATIDYNEDISGGQFRISNPNAKTTCGCGSSFSA